MVKRDASGKKGMLLSCRIINAFSSRLELIWPISSLKISKMSRKCSLGEKLQESMGFFFVHGHVMLINLPFTTNTCRYETMVNVCHDFIVSMITELKYVYLTFLLTLRPMEIKGIQEKHGVKDLQDNKK